MRKKTLDRMGSNMTAFPKIMLYNVTFVMSGLVQVFLAHRS